MVRIFLAICIIVSYFGGQVMACEFQDTGTKTRMFVKFSDIERDLDIHMCKGGSFMVGVQVEENRFLCEDSIGIMGWAYDPSDLQPNYALDQRVRYISHGMSACLPPTAMVGLDVDHNVLLCAPCPGLVTMLDLFVDVDTVREDMHACPEGSVMTGVLLGHDLLLCAPVR